MKPWILPTFETHGRIALEHEEQQDLIRFFRRTFRGVRIFHIPNGGKRGKQEGVRFKAIGVSAGVPDLFVPAWQLWIEMKDTKGGDGMSADQVEWKEYLEGIGQTVLVPWGSLAAQAMVMEFALQRGFCAAA